MSGFVKAGQTFLKALMSGGKQKTTGKEVISNIGIAKNVDTKRNIQDNVVSAVDSAFKKANVPPSLINQQKKSKLKKDESKKLKDVSYKLDKLEEKVKAKKFNKGGRVGLKRGTGLMKTKSNIKKIKETFGPKKGLGMQSVIYGLDKNPKITAADPKAKFIAAANKKKKKKII